MSRKPHPNPKRYTIRARVNAATKKKLERQAVVMKMTASELFRQGLDLVMSAKPGKKGGCCCE
jgi:hypothetical protein